MTYFTLTEFVRSQTAARKGICNDPPAAVRRNLMRLVDELLDPLREAWGAECVGRSLGTPALRVNSGYRSKTLNAAVGGAPNSAHCTGFAADIVPLNGCMSAFSDFARRFVAGRDFDQLILEDTDSGGVPAWVHLGLQGPGGVQRCEVLVCREGKYTQL